MQINHKLFILYTVFIYYRFEVELVKVEFRQWELTLARSRVPVRVNKGPPVTQGL